MMHLTLFLSALAEAGETANESGVLEMRPGGGAPDFQPYVFWSYGAVCLLLFAFTAYTLWQAWTLQERVRYLQKRFEDAFPEETPER